MLTTHFTGTLNYVQRHWPIYLFGLGGGALLVMVSGVTAVLWEWWGLIPLALAVLLLLYYFLFASLWAAHQLYDNPKMQPADVLFVLGELRSDDRLVIVELGDNLAAQHTVRHLTTGKLIVVDIYDPQIMPQKALSRLRAQAKPHHDYRHDPRISWQPGRVDLLPLPDATVFAVIMSHTARHIATPHDLDLLMQEIYRILRPGGRLLLAEPVRTQTRWLVHGPGALFVPPPAHWRNLLAANGFTVVQEHTYQGLLSFMRVDKLTAGVGRQLPFQWK